MGGSVGQGVEILAHVSGIGGKLGWAGLGYPVRGLDFKYGDAQAVVQVHGLGSGVRDAILEPARLCSLARFSTSISFFEIEACWFLQVLRDFMPSVMIWSLRCVHLRAMTLVVS